MTEEEIEQLKAELAAAKAAKVEAGSGTDEATRNRLAYLEEEQKKLIAARDRAKEEKRLADEAKLAEQGEFKTLAEQKQAKLDALQAEIDKSNEKLNGYKQRDEAELKQLIDKVPESLREIVEDETLTVEKRLSMARKLIAEKPTAPGARLPGSVPDVTLKEQHAAAIASGNMALAISLKRQMFEKE